MKKFFDEFRKFALKGNVMDMAVGVIIGGAFQAIVASLTGDVISPLLGIFGQADFSTFVLNINGSEIRYGAFITAIINFIIMALIIFVMLKAINKLKDIGTKKDDTPQAPTTKVCPYCQSEISIKATRCPHCTSMLTETPDIKKD
jgi:large conductance mechanosensitive channel